jgi:hypothetical protein
MHPAAHYLVLATEILPVPCPASPVDLLPFDQIPSAFHQPTLYGMAAVVRSPEGPGPARARHRLEPRSARAAPRLPSVHRGQGTGVVARRHRFPVRPDRGGVPFEALKRGLREHYDYVLLGNPFGPNARGRRQVEASLAGAAPHYREGEITGAGLVAKYAQDGLACVVEVPRGRAKVVGNEELVPVIDAARPLSVRSSHRRRRGGLPCVELRDRSEPALDVRVPVDRYLRLGGVR